MPYLEVNFSPFVSFDEILSGVALEAAEIVEGKIVGLMNEPKHGYPYLHQDGTLRPASAEGEAPGIDSMDLVGSFDVIPISAMEAQIFSGVEYVNELQEERNRPYTEPAIEEAMPEIVELVEKRIEERWR